MDWEGLGRLFGDAMSGAWTSFCGLMGMLFVFALLEQARPAARAPRRASVLFNLTVTALYVSLGAALGSVVRHGFVRSALRRAEAPLLTVERGADVWHQLLTALLFVLVVDFFYYWFHRLQHTRLLWWQHRLHHSDQAVNATTTNRHHWSEEALRGVLLWLPIGLLVEVEPTTLSLLALGFAAWGIFIHANLRIELGILTPVVSGPQYHRIHHSVWPEHLDRNFAAYFPIWDILFGTYVSPASGQFPPTGLAQGESSREDWRSALLAYPGQSDRRSRR